MRQLMLTLFISLFITGLSFGQGTSMTTYNAPNDDNINYSIVQMSDSSFIMGGYYGQGFGFSDIQLIKTDKNGDTTWTRSYGSIFNDRAYDMIAVSSGGYATVGRSSSFGQGGFGDVFVTRISGNGTLQWSETYGGTNFEQGHSIFETSDGGFILANFDGYLIKIDASGNLQWDKTYGGPQDDDIQSVEQTSDGGYILAGMTESSGVGGQDILVIKTDAMGDTTWANTVGGFQNERAWDVHQLTDGSYILVGSSSSWGVGSDDLYLIHLSSSGTLDWSTVYGTSNSEAGYDVIELSDGSLVIAGQANGDSFGGNTDVYLLKTNSTGIKDWSMTYGGPNTDNGRGLIQTLSGGFAIAAYTESFAGGQSFFLIITDPDGKTGLCYEKVASDMVSLPNSAINAANIIVGMGSAVVSNPMPQEHNYGTSQLTLKMGAQFFIQTPTPGNSDGSIIIIVSGGAAPFSYQWDDPNAQTTQTATGLPVGTYTCVITDNAGCTITIVAFLQAQAGIGDYSSNLHLLKVYPNPGQGQFILDFEAEAGKLSQLNVYSIDGVLIRSYDKMNRGLSAFNLDLSDLDKGIYFLQAITDDKSITTKLVIQ